MPTAVLKLNSFHGRACPEFWHPIRTFFTATSVLKTEILFPYFLWRKGHYFRLIWPLRLPPPPLVMLFIRATILTSVSPSLSIRSQSVSSSWLSFWPGFVTSFNRQAEELTCIPIPLLTVNLRGLLIQTRRGRWNCSYLSPLSGRPHDNMKPHLKNSDAVKPIWIYTFPFRLDALKTRVISLPYYIAIQRANGWIRNFKGISTKWNETSLYVYIFIFTLWKEYGCNLQDTFRLFGCAITMTSWFGDTCVRYEQVAQL